jgi:hypothetical protein
MDWASSAVQEPRPNSRFPIGKLTLLPLNRAMTRVNHPIARADFSTFPFASGRHGMYFLAMDDCSASENIVG